MVNNNKVKYARITITHALTLAGSLERCFNTRPISLVFKQHPRNPESVNAWKNMCDPYIHNDFETDSQHNRISWVYTRYRLLYTHVIDLFSVNIVFKLIYFSLLCRFRFLFISSR